MSDAVQSMMAEDEASRGLGIVVVSSGIGEAVTQMTVRPDMVNGHGIAHGAFLFAVADTAFACACNSHGPVTVAATAEITFIAPAHAGDVLQAHAVERTRWGRSGICDVTITRAGDVVAEFRGLSRTVAR